MKKYTLILLLVMSNIIFAEDNKKQAKPEDKPTASIDCADADNCFTTAEELIKNNDFKQAATYLQENCETNTHGKSCTELAELFFDAKLGAQDIQKAKKYHQIGCNSSSLKSCFTLGTWYEEGNIEGIVKNISQAKEFYNLSCEKDYGDACWKIGTFWETGVNKVQGQKTPDRAEHLFRKSCKFNSAQGCFSYAKILEEGLYGASRDRNEALTLYQQSCSLGLKEACEYADVLQETINNKQ
ncbi:MAG: sel1 repeat family protein [Cardiobacteriaceae bacterium]|nr:sel1 repeat family protein [Cardiobacteriaceae bacterium]